MRRQEIRRIGIFAIAGLLAGVAAEDGIAATPGLDASVWDSTVSADGPNGIFPIGGSGQINGAFVIDEFIGSAQDSAIQLGLRAQERFVGPSWPTAGTEFFVQAGESTPGLAKWNFDMHIDFGTTFLGSDLGLGLTPLDMRDFEVTLESDTDPGPGTSFVTLDLNQALTDLGVGSPVVLVQMSQNAGFPIFGGPIDINAAGTYDFRLTVEDTTGVVAQTEMTVTVVPEPASAVVFALGGLLAVGWTSRRKSIR